MRKAMTILAVLLFINPAPMAAQKSSQESPSSGTNATTSDEIGAGIGIDLARKTLQHHGYNETYLLSLSPGKENIDFETRRIDDNIVLTLTFDKGSKKVVRLSLHVIPNPPTSKSQQVARDIMSIGFEKDGVYSVRLKREARTSKATK